MHIHTHTHTSGTLIRQKKQKKIETAVNAACHYRHAGYMFHVPAFGIDCRAAEKQTLMKQNMGSRLCE